MGNTAVIGSEVSSAVGGSNVEKKKAGAVGASLKSARESRKLSLDEASRATKIRKEFLVAIEEERFDLLPGDVFARGFVRSYGEFLGLDGAGIAARAAERLSSATLPPPAGSRERVSGGGVSRALRLGIVALLAATAWWLQHKR